MRQTTTPTSELHIQDEVCNARITNRVNQILQVEVRHRDWVVLIDSLLKLPLNMERCISVRMCYFELAMVIVIVWEHGEMALPSWLSSAMRKFLFCYLPISCF